jgi:hypothetical protein
MMERLLIPADLRHHLVGPAPLVMVLDTTAARIHWEMVAQTTSVGDWPAEMSGTEDDLQRAFLGTSRGFTRQLVTTFAPAPQPPPPPRRLLRVLVVADPAEDARLPGAEEEGVAVADLFETFNEVWGPESDNRVTVVRLLGSTEATRTHVLRHLMLRSYDVLHYAGHCVFDERDFNRQGWVFTDGELLSPNELKRIDRIPKFVFSNGCESGITPDRSEERSAGLAPGFAESFFQRGVANFVWTARRANSRSRFTRGCSGLSRTRITPGDTDRWRRSRCTRRCMTPGFQSSGRSPARAHGAPISTTGAHTATSSTHGRSVDRRPARPGTGSHTGGRRFARRFLTPGSSWQSMQTRPALCILAPRCPRAGIPSGLTTRVR